MIRAVFFDLDGTLLDSKKQIPVSAKHAILRCRAKGIKAYFATARSPRLDKTLRWTEDEFALFDGEVYSNGAVIRLDGDVQYCYVDPQAVCSCINAASRFDQVHLSLHMPDEGYAFNFRVDESMNEGWGLSGARICPIDDEAISHTLKILLFYDHLTDSNMKLPEALYDRILQGCKALSNVYLTDEGRTIQISGICAGKLKALERIRMDMGWKKEEIAVFGDDMNDYEMISFYPHSVAMGNAAESIKHTAEFVTRSNDEGGIAYALDMLMGNQDLL